jgi:hypothetical protein
MNTNNAVYENVTVEISRNSYAVHIIVTGDDFSQEFVASANEMLDGPHGLWFGTFEEYADWAQQSGEA